MKSVSEVLAILIIIAATISALTVAMTVITGYLKTHQPRGESIDTSVIVQRSLPSSGSISTIKATIYVTCSGPNCDKYVASGLTLYGYDRVSGNYWVLGSDTNNYRISQGVNTLAIVGYYNVYNQNINEVVVYFRLTGPSYYRDIYKSVSIG